jgi:phospholipid/cholesterol/gamma-HCH transport system permease protein
MNREFHNAFLSFVGTKVLDGCAEAGAMLILLVQCLRELPQAMRRKQRLIVQMKRVGPDSLFIAGALALFIGMVLALHTGYGLERFDFEEALAPIVALGMVKEMAPVITALLLSGRIGAAIAAELGTMQVNEEIDALHTLGVSPIRYLAIPRLIACVTMLPLLTIYAGIVGIYGGALIADHYFGISYTIYFQRAFDSMEMKDVTEGLVKAFLFGGIVAIVACRRGFSTRGGAEGVGRAITQSVVTSFIAIIICDYFVTRFMM